MPKPPFNPDAYLRRLEWTVLRRLDGLLQGNYRTLFRGQGLDLADLREYQYGDDVRHIDWNVTARLQTPHVREYHEDREINAWFLLDLSSSVDFGSEVKKQAIAGGFVALIARLLTRQGNRVGAVLYGNRVDRVIPARGGRRHVLHLMHAIASRAELPPAPKGTNLRELLEGAYGVINRRSLVFLVSDFLSTPGWERPLGQLAQRHELIAVRLYDPMENELPDLGMVVMQDAETGEQMFVDTHDRGFRTRFAAASQRREAALRGAFARSGVDVLELSTGDDLVGAIRRFAELRKRSSRIRGGRELSVA